MRVMVEQDHRLTRAVLITLGILAAALLLIAVQLLQSCRGRPPLPATDGQSSQATQAVHRAAH